MKCRIHELREERGMRQNFLAEKVGVKPSTLNDWEHDRTQPRIEHAYKIADVLGVDVKELYKEG